MTTLPIRSRFFPPALLGLLWVIPAAALAQAPPDAGSLLRQVQPAAPLQPKPAGSGLKIEQPRAGQMPVTTPFEVLSLRITGNTVVDTATLQALVAEAQGQRLTLTQLDQIVGRITAYYRRAGYLLARAYIPAQTIDNGLVQIEVIEARYGQVQIANRSRVSTDLLSDATAQLAQGAVVAQAELDRALLLLSDIPGVDITATLKPGAAVGSSDLLVAAEPGAEVAASVLLDNQGNRYTGRWRASGQLSWFNPLRRGDILSASLLSSGSGARYGRLGYDTLVTGSGIRIGAVASALDYRLGNSAAALGSHGTAQVGSLWVRQPLLRSADANVYLQAQADRTVLHDRVDVSSLRNDRHLTTGSLVVSVDRADAWLAGGTTAASLGLNAGRVAFTDAQANQSDAATARTQRRYTKLSYTLSRQQALGQDDSLRASFSGQWSDGNLDPSEKFASGGPSAVRGYDTGTPTGDAGQLLKLEWRHALHALADWTGGRWQSALFVDHARITVNRRPWVSGNNHANLTGAGVGLAWVGSQGWQARLNVAAPVGSRPSLLAQAERSTRAWADLTWHY